MEELIKITTNDEGQKLVSARELHGFLESKERFSKWWGKVLEYGFKENEDYYKFEFVHSQNKQSLVDYNISLPMAIRKIKHTKFNPKASIIEKHIYSIIDAKYVYKESKRKELEFGEMLDKITGLKWDRQYPIDNGKYRLDFYLKDILIVEYDEKYHNYRESEDTYRMKYCVEWMANNVFDDGWNCPYIRVKEGYELEGLNRIIRHLAGFEVFDTQYNYNLEVCGF